MADVCVNQRNSFEQKAFPMSKAIVMIFTLPQMAVNSQGNFNVSHACCQIDSLSARKIGDNDLP